MSLVDPHADTGELLAFFKALADESRLKIIGLIAGRERTGAELAELLELKAPTVSHHLAVLSRLGLVTTRAEGTTHWHALAPARLAAYRQSLFEPAGLEKLAPAKPTFEERVLAAFVGADGRLLGIPASRRKRVVILIWLADAFEEGRDYPEAEVNDLIGRRHPDFATLRRELIGHAMMERSENVWRRLPKTGWRLN